MNNRKEQDLVHQKGWASEMTGFIFISFSQQPFDHKKKDTTHYSYQGGQAIFIIFKRTLHPTLSVVNSPGLNSVLSMHSFPILGCSTEEEA